MEQEVEVRGVRVRVQIWERRLNKIKIVKHPLKVYEGSGVVE